MTMIWKFTDQKLKLKDTKQVFDMSLANNNITLAFSTQSYAAFKIPIINNVWFQSIYKGFLGIILRSYWNNFWNAQSI